MNFTKKREAIVNNKIMQPNKIFKEKQVKKKENL